MRMQPRASTLGPVPAGRRHPLLHAFPLAVITLAIVVLLFAFAMAELNRGTPGLHAGTSAAIPGLHASTSAAIPGGALGTSR